MIDEKTVKTDIVFMKYEKDMLFGKYLVRKLNLDVAQHVMDLQVKSFGKAVNYVITDLSNVKSVTKEARDYFSLPQFSEHVMAAAFIAPTFLHKLMYTFFLTFNKPVVPTAFFYNLQDATNWIEKHQKVQQR
ncbi:MAG: hypothetical protein EOP53_07195 [Sphingobacteriales bacterium]|nr:MAG: hypothetical protein EOP53_07195 [Sphingobacteriales bacterium]